MSLEPCATGFLLSLLALGEAWKTLDHAHSLCLDLTVQAQSGPGQPWCEVQGSVDRKPFLQYDSDSNKLKPLGPLGEKVKATRAWTELLQMMGEMGRELRMTLAVLKLKRNKTKGPPTLQAQLCCEREAERCTGASWRLSFEGQTTLLFDAMTVTWTGTGPGARGIKEDWAGKKELTEYFRKTANGDCNHWLKEFLAHWDDVLAPTEVPDTQQPTAIQVITWTIPAFFICSVITAAIIMKHRRTSGTIGALPLSDNSSLDHETASVLMGETDPR